MSNIRKLQQNMIHISSNFSHGHNEHEVSIRSPADFGWSGE